MNDVLSELSDDEAPSVQVDKLKRAYSKNESQSSFRNVPMAQEQIARQMKAEVGFGNRMEGLQKESVSGTTAGILPIQIQIPTSGQVYRFARTIIKSDDVLSVEVYFSSSWTNDVFRWIIYLLIVLILWFLRLQLKKVFNWLKSFFDTWLSLS